MIEMDPHLNVKVQQFEINSQHFGSIMHTLGFFTLFCTFLSVYLILYKSTIHMRVYKWYLLNIAICCGLFDAYLSLIYTPNLLLPVFGVCLDGLWSEYMKERGFSITCFIIVVFLMIAVNFSTTIAFLYRFAITHSADAQFQRYRTFFFIFIVYIVAVFPPVCLFLYAMLYDPAEISKKIQEQNPAIYKFSLDKACVFMSIKVTPKAVISATLLVMIAISTSMIINLTMVFVILRRLRRDKDKFSRTTHAMHRQLTISLAFQFALPALFNVIPTLVVDSQILSGQLEETVSMWLCQILIQAMGLHSTLNFVTMIMMIRPYRKAAILFFRRLFCWRNKKALSWTSSISEPSALTSIPKQQRDQRKEVQRNPKHEVQVQCDPRREVQAPGPSQKRYRSAGIQRKDSNLDKQRKVSSQSDQQSQCNNVVTQQSDSNNQRSDSGRYQNKSISRIQSEETPQKAFTQRISVSEIRFHPNF